MEDYSTYTLEQLFELKHNLDEKYSAGNSEIPDFIYDKLVKFIELKQSKEVEMRVESPTEGFTQVSHIQPMLSLKDVYTTDEVYNFFKKVESADLILMPKYDGLSAELQYTNGVLKHVVTRGNSVEGTDIIRHRHLMVNIPKYVGMFSGAIYGELLIAHKEFTRINSIQKENKDTLFANPRNLVSGTMKLLESAGVDRKVEFHAFDSTQNFELHTDNLDFLKRIGFSTDYTFIQGTATLQSEIINTEQTRYNLLYPIDGSVVRVNSNTAFNKLGATTSYPKGAVAFKFKSEKAKSKLLSIKYTTGRTGKVTPVAKVLPVLLMGTTVQSASLYNKTFVDRLEFRLNDTVTLAKGGDIIPEIVSTEGDGTGEILRFPDNCPSCNSTLLHGNKLSYCNNRDCRAQLQAKFEHFCSKKGMNIEIGEKGIEQVLASGVTELHQIYQLTAQKIQSFDRFAEISSLKLLSSIEDSRNIKAVNFLIALGIPKVGATLAKKFITHYGSAEEFIAFCTYDSLVSIKGVADTTAITVLNYLKDVENIKQIASLLVYVVLTKQKQGNVFGKTFCITGIFKNFNTSRGEMVALIEQQGGVVTQNVSKTTDYLILGVNKAATKKEITAAKWKTPIINYEQFNKLLNAEEN